MVGVKQCEWQPVPPGKPGLDLPHGLSDLTVITSSAASQWRAGRPPYARTSQPGLAASPAEHHHSADPVAGRRDRAAPARHEPAARHLATGLRGTARPATAFMHAAGITCSQRLGDLLAALDPADEATAVALLGATR
jgi:hypothetical protein